MEPPARHREKNTPGQFIAFVRNNIATERHQQWFLRAIQPKFLENVDPVVSGFLDYLYSEHVINDRENSSFCGRECTTRLMKARKLFIILNKVSVEVFRDKVVPELCSKFRHLVDNANFDEMSIAGRDSDDTHNARAQRCLRHMIVDSRITPTELSDILFHRGLMDLCDYGTVSEDDLRKKDQAWVTVLTTMEKAASVKADVLTNTLRCLLVTYCLPVPDDLKNTVSRGLPCACTPERLTLPASPSTQQEEVEMWLDKSADEAGLHVQYHKDIHNTWSTQRNLVGEENYKFRSSDPSGKKRRVRHAGDVFTYGDEELALQENRRFGFEAGQERSPDTTTVSGTPTVEMKPLLRRQSSSNRVQDDTPKRRFPCHRDTIQFIVVLLLLLYCAVLMTVHVFVGVAL
ncbi:uncharacterized protein [Littorina saxatilis]|uniref:uncharacterized protein n=1 Tax=Littorina saxatilis TaxID=31220 RepID=UPI0038B65136